MAFKQRSDGVTGPVTWRLWVLDLDTGTRHPLAETRNVDDQAEWLDDEHVLYALPGGDGRTAIMDEWITPADGGGEPRLFLPEATPPASIGRAAGRVRRHGHESPSRSIFTSAAAATCARAALQIDGMSRRPEWLRSLAPIAFS